MGTYRILYTLIKDEMKTLKYILGSLDDLLEFYSSFSKMNLFASKKRSVVENLVGKSEEILSLTPSISI